MIIGLVGNLGRGKTLGMTMLGYYLRESTKLDKVVSNYQTDLTTRYVSNAGELDEASQEIEGIYLLDEIWAWMSSRTAMENDDMVEIVLNSRKRGCLIVYTVQDLSQVDPILKNNTDYFGIPTHYESHEVDEDFDVAEVQLIDADGNPARCFKYNAETYYGTYDTSEEVSSVDDREKYNNHIEELKKGFIEGEYEHKKEAWSYLKLNTSLSHSQMDAIVDEAYRMAEKSEEDENGGEEQNGLQKFG